MRSRRKSIGAPGWLWIVIGLGLTTPPTRGTFHEIEFLGEARIAGGLIVGETPVGGLSGITFDASRNLFLAVVDDPSAGGPARFYTLRIDLRDGRLAEDGAEVSDMRVIQTPGGGPMPRMTVDPEGIALHPDDSLYISSEGQIKKQVAPFIRRFSRDGEYLGELALPDRYQPDPNGLAGPRHNRGFESLTVTRDGRFLFAALENALLQDGPEATLEAASPSRLIRFDLMSGEVAAEYVYMAEPVARASSVPDGMEVAGLVDILAVDSQHLLAMERSFSMGVGNTIRVFEISLLGATDVQFRKALGSVDMSALVPVRKELLLDLTELGIYLDNVEGLTFGPTLADGRQTLILVSDNNFNSLVQTTQILAFAIGTQPVDIERVQGAAHRSPLEGRWVRGVEGLITGIYPGKESGFWMESLQHDGELATSRGVLVIPNEDSSPRSSGDRVAVDGRVLEKQRPGELSGTRIQASKVMALEEEVTLPPPVKLGPGGVKVPSEVVDDDELQIFEPEFDGLDFWESLEGMRITLAEPRVIGPTNRYGDITVDASDSSSASDSRSRVGGLMLRPGDFNPERLVLDFSGVGEAPDVDVGARFGGSVEGIVGYNHSMYRVYLQESPRLQESAHLQPEITTLAGGKGRLTIATFNVLNLTTGSSEDHFHGIAQTLTVSLRSPAIVALQEIQDDTGSLDDGTISAAATLERLIDVVARNGGPDYEYRQIDPENNRDGGRPGSNIRVAFLFDPSRVSFQDRGRPSPWQAVELMGRDGETGLSVNPGRIQPSAPAFNEDETRGFSGSRKPLIAEFEFGAERLLVVNNHWSSKGSDDRVFGEIQPPMRHSEDQRSQQARLVADFVIAVLQTDPQANIVVLGDFNDHEFRPPLRVLTAAPLSNLVYRLPANDRYSYNYRGGSQLLDHILVSRPLLKRARPRIDIVHANSDLADARSSSDHDPVLVELDFTQGDDQ